MRTRYHLRRMRLAGTAVWVVVWREGHPMQADQTRATREMTLWAHALHERGNRGYAK